MRKWIPAIPIVVGLGVSAGAYRTLPAEVRPDWSRVLPFAAVSEPLPRLAFVLLIPVVAVVVWALLAALATVRGRGGAGDSFLNERAGASAIARFEPTYALVITAVVGLLVLFHIALVASVADWPEWTIRAVGVVLGLGTAAIGNLVPRIRPNWIVGIRTRATLSDPALWLRTHRYFGVLLMAVGIGVAILSFFASHLAFTATLIGLLVALVLSHWLGGRRSAQRASAVLL